LLVLARVLARVLVLRVQPLQGQIQGSVAVCIVMHFQVGALVQLVHHSMPVLHSCHHYSSDNGFTFEITCIRKYKVKLGLLG
jgi:hypothetical protein